MDQITPAMEMADHLPHPAFCVRDGVIVKTNRAAEALLLEPGTKIRDLLENGHAEYKALTTGSLYLTLRFCGQSHSACVCRKQDFELFELDTQSTRPELHAMALAARELRIPLTTAMLTAERLSPGEFSGPDTLHQLSLLNHGLYQILRLVTNMSDAARYDAEGTFHPELRDICSILQEIFEKAAVLTEASGVRLEFTGIPEPVYTLVDEEKLERAVYNIISNSLAFTPAGASIRAALTRRGKQLQLSIADSGTGIQESIRTNLFQRYSRQPTIEDGRHGIGLGIFLIRRTAELHGGTVLIDAPDQCGTRVTMTIAIRSTDGQQVRTPQIPVDYSGEHDHGLLELANVLPERLYGPQK